jgi:hypothetical protein
VIFLENHIYFMTNFIWAGVRPPQVFRRTAARLRFATERGRGFVCKQPLVSLTSFAWLFVKNFFGF